MPTPLVAVAPPDTPIGAAAAELCRRLSARAGEPVPYAFALAAVRAAEEFGALPGAGAAAADRAPLGFAADPTGGRAPALVG